MKNYWAFIIVLVLSSCSNGSVGVADNGLNFTLAQISDEQTELIYEKVQSFPENTELAFALIKNEKIQFFGIKRINDTIQQVINHESVFEIGSITKVFTATLLLNFVLDEELRLEDAIQDYLSFTIKTEDKITFKQLASHTSGLPRLPSNFYSNAIDLNNPYKEYDARRLKEYLTDKIDLTHEPGTKYKYSNLGAGLLGYIMAEVSKSTYEDLLQKRIFAKFGMLNSTSKRDRIKGKLVTGLNAYGKETSNWDFDVLAGGGAIFSSLVDLSKFAIAQFDSVNSDLIYTHKPVFTVNDKLKVGLGWHILKRDNGKELIWHNGGTGGYTSSMALDTENKNGIIILSNVSVFNKQRENIDQLCFELMEILD